MFPQPHTDELVEIDESGTPPAVVPIPADQLEDLRQAARGWLDAELPNCTCLYNPLRLCLVCRVRAQLEAHS
jgi:hypothetical protein